MDNVVLPDSWGLSNQQDIVIGNVIDFAGSYITAAEFCEDIYDEDIDGSPAPAKLRVLIQRCRAILDEVTDGKCKIAGKRNHGWKMTKVHSLTIKKIIADAQ